MFKHYTILFPIVFCIIFHANTQEKTSKFPIPIPHEIRTEFKDGSWQTKTFNDLNGNAAAHALLFIYNSEDNQFYVYNECLKNEFKERHDCHLVIGYDTEVLAHEIASLQDIDKNELASLTISAMNGSAKAQYDLASRYITGDGVPENEKRAFEWYLSAAQKRNTDAQVEVAKFYEEGIVVQKDIGKALFWFARAAIWGKNGEAAYKLGEYALEDEEDDVAFSWFSESGALFYAPGLVKTGICFEQGIGTEKDPKRAFENYRLAVISFDDDDGLCNLGRCFLWGIGTEINYQSALDYFNRAWKQENSRAAYHIGLMYSGGFGVEKNEKQAFEWFTRSAELEDDCGQVELADCYRLSIGAEKDLVKAIELYKKSAAQGNGNALSTLGFCYQFGDGIEKNISEAVKCFKLAAQKGIPEAQYQLAVCYEQGIEVRRDFKEAFKWFEKSAFNDDLDARDALGGCYEFGRGVDVDLKWAFVQYLTAAKKGHIAAQYNVARMYESGSGTDKNLDAAVAWYTKAAEQGDADAKEALEDLLAMKKILNNKESKK